MNDQHTLDLAFMQIALDQARQAACMGEVPVGAALVHGETLLATASNRPITTNDLSNHIWSAC